MMLDYFINDVRSSAILTTSYVAGTVTDEAQNQNQLIVLVDFTKGSLTSAELKVEFTNQRKYTLAYDNQTANFTVGATVYNTNKTASGEITADTDGGTSGTLTLTNVRGTFTDNEGIVDSSGGAALANGTLADASDYYQETASAVSGGTSTDSILEHTFTATGKYRLPIPLKDRFVRISVKGTGTTTSSLMAIKAVIGRV